MTTTLNQPVWQNPLYQRWVFLPVLAHLLSLFTGILSFAVFPIFLTIAHYLILRRCAVVLRPGLWFITLPITWYIWVKWGPFMQTIYTANHDSIGVAYGIAAYYGGQLFNAVVIPFMTDKHQIRTTVTWLLCIIITGSVWLALYILFTEFYSSLSNYDLRPAEGLPMIVIYPIISLISNSLSGIFFVKNTASHTYESTE